MENAAADKKKPGRPKKKQAHAPIEVHGIVNAPVNEEDVLELVYGNPTMFKKLLTLYKQFDVSELEITFGPAEVRFFATDHYKKSNIYTTIDARCMNLYYSAMPIRICIKRDSLERVLSMLDKTHYKIEFVLKDNYRSVMYMNVKDLEYNSDETFDIEVLFKAEDAGAAPADDDADYPIRYKVNSRHFKKRINNIRKLSPIFTLQKVGDGPLSMTYPQTQRVNWTGSYNDSDKIGLECALAPDDIFSVSLNIEYIRPFSNSNIGEEVIIAADKTERMSFTTYLDKTDLGSAACVKVFATIGGTAPK